MLEARIIRSIPAMSGPLLSVYLNTGPAMQSKQGAKPDYLTRFASQVNGISQSVPQSERELFLAQVARAEARLAKHPPRCRSIVIFAGKDSWQFVPLQVPVEDEVHWGTPAIAQFLWLFEEHKRIGIVLPGRKKARFFLYWLGEIRELEEKAFHLEPSRKKEMGPVSRPGVRLSRGTNRDVYEHHRAAEYEHYCREIARRMETWIASEKLQSVFVVGLPRMVNAVQGSVSTSLANQIVPVATDLGWLSRSKLLQRIEPDVLQHKRDRERQSVQTLLGDSRNAVTGIDEVLAQLQQGNTRNIVVAKGLSADLQRCLNCSWVDRTADPRCPSCGGKRERAVLRDLLPDLVRRYNVSLEIVSGDSAEMLQGSGGIGALLREFEKKEYSAFAAG
jgi:hypothetical protein